MALKALLIKRKITNKKTELEELRKKDSEFQKREKELEEAVNETDEKISEEDQKALDEEVEKFTDEKDDFEKQKSDLESEISDLEDELKKLEESQPEEKRDDSKEKEKEKEKREKGEKNKMEVRTKFYDLDIQQRNELFADEKVKSFITELRTCIKEKRAIAGEGLLIPQNFIPMIKQVIEKTSKLLNYVNKDILTGTGRMVIMGSIPEGIWTEQCGTLNELELGFNDVETDGFKVGGFFKVNNNIIEDNDIDLASQLIEALGIGIAKAIDKAIVYGTGIKMPLGFVTRIFQETAPENRSKNEREWKDLHQSNVIKIENKEGVKLFQQIVKCKKIIKNDYNSDNLIWIMNQSTHTDLIAEAMGCNMSAAIVSGMNNTMPVIGGEIVELNFMNDGDIAFGYMKNYKTVQRKEMKIGQSDQVKFIEEQTLFKGTARYDGKPVIAESFAIININGKEPTKSVLFAPDKANLEDVELTSLAVGTNALFPTFKKEVREYMVNTNKASSKIDVKMANEKATLEIKNGDAVIKNGESVTWTDGENKLTITVGYAGIESVYTVIINKEATVGA